VYEFKEFGGPLTGPVGGKMINMTLPRKSLLANVPFIPPPLRIVNMVGEMALLEYGDAQAAQNAAKEFDKQVQAAYDYIKANRKDNEPVDIFGYSRGAIAAVYLARKLKDDNIEIRYMGLLDPSYTYSGHDAVGIPSNVKLVHIFFADGTELKTQLVVQHSDLSPDDPS